MCLLHGKLGWCTAVPHSNDPDACASANHTSLHTLYALQHHLAIVTVLGICAYQPQTMPCTLMSLDSLASAEVGTLCPRPVLYCTVLYCTVLYCTALHCTALHCTVLYCTVLYCNGSEPNSPAISCFSCSTSRGGRSSSKSSRASSSVMIESTSRRSSDTSWPRPPCRPAKALSAAAAVRAFTSASTFSACSNSSSHVATPDQVLTVSAGIDPTTTLSQCQSHTPSHTHP